MKTEEWGFPRHNARDEQPVGNDSTKCAPGNGVEAERQQDKQPWGSS